MSLVNSFEAKELKKRPWAIRIADDLTASFGGISFLVINVLFFGVWISINTGLVPGVAIFDVFPFPLLTTIVSLEAIFLSIIVLMSAQRQSYISTLREELDMQVNLIAEQEITKILKLLRELHKKDNKAFEDPELDEMLHHTNISYIERQLQKQIDEASSGGKKTFKSVFQPIEKVTEEIESHLLPKK